MNRLMAPLQNLAFGIPHRRGDEPDGEYPLQRDVSVFPTGVGMNR